jgi:lysozyme
MSAFWPIDEKAVNLIKHFESLHDGDQTAVGLQPKLCPAGIWTVGWGRALTDPDTGQFLMGEGDREAAYAMYPALTEREADFMLADDLEEFADGVGRLVRVNMAACQFGALVSFSYNVGLSAFESSTLRRLLNLSKIDDAATQFLRWNKGGGRVLPGLTRRREAEKKLFLTGVLDLDV